MSDTRYRRNAGSVFSLKYHLVWCRKYRRKVLMGEIADDLCSLLYQKAQELGVTIEALEIMPDHVHLFCAPAGWETGTVKDWCKFWKRSAGNLLPALQSQFEWDCWDTQMRSVGHYCRKLSYVALNPVRKGLVAKTEDWPYQGRLNPLWW